MSRLLCFCRADGSPSRHQAKRRTARGPRRYGRTGLDLAPSFRHIPPERCSPMLDPVSKPRRVLWQNVSTVLSAAILIGAEVFGAAFAGGWALANLFGLGLYGEYVLTAAFVLGGIAIMAGFIPNGMKVEPFTVRQ